jgi:hypothetical protein
MLLTLALALSLMEPAPAATLVAAPTTPVTSPLLDRYRSKVVTSASTTWPGWGPERLIDGDPRTSWFSARGDAAALGKKPWVALAFPQDVTVKKVSLLGNREPI